MTGIVEIYLATGVIFFMHRLFIQRADKLMVREVSIKNRASKRDSHLDDKTSRQGQTPPSRQGPEDSKNRQREKVQK